LHVRFQDVERISEARLPGSTLAPTFNGVRAGAMGGKDQEGAEPARASTPMTGDTCSAAALPDQGIILQPDFVIYRDLKAGALVWLMPEFRAAELGIFAVYPARKQLPLKVRRLVDFLVAALRDPVWGTR